MSVLHVCFSDGWGGLEQYPLTLDKPFRDLGIQVYYWGFKNTQFTKKALESGSQVLEFSNRVEVLWRARQLVAWIREKEIKAIHFHKSTDVRIAYFLRLFLPDTCLVFTEHMNVKRPKKSFYHRLVYSALNYVVAISKHTRANNLKALPISEKKLVQIYSGIDLERFRQDLGQTEKEQIRNELGVGSNCVAIALPGRITVDKRQDVFIQSFEVLKESLPDRCVKAVVIGGLDVAHGSDEPAVKKLVGMVENSKFKNDIILAGYRSDMHQIMQAMDIVCIPSREEPFGLVVIESMALGLPIVGSNSGAIPEILGEDESFGLLATPNEPASFAEKLSMLVAEPELKEELAGRALNRIKEEFDIQLHVLRLAKLYGCAPK